MIQEQDMKKRASIPPIDRNIPAKVETATFTLG